MNDSNPLPNPEAPQVNFPEHSRRRTERWVPGLILIVLGAVFLVNNISGFELHNWWAIFILIPAVGAFARAYDRYQHSGSVDRYARQAIFSGVLLISVASVFLFNLSWTLFGPVILILLGLTLLGNEFLP